MLKESDDLDILRVTFDFKLTFEHLRSVFRAASHRLCFLRKSWQVFHDIFERWLRGFVLPVLWYWSAVWCSAADTYFKLLDSVVFGIRFLIRGVFDYDIPHLRSVAILFIFYKFRCNAMYTLYDPLPVPMLVTSTPSTLQAWVNKVESWRIRR